MQNDINCDPTINDSTSISSTNNKVSHCVPLLKMQPHLRKGVVPQGVHIKIKQRNGKKSNTFVENLPKNLPKNLDIEQLAKKMRQTFHCNGCVHNDETGSSIQLFGDQRLVVKKFLISNSIVEETDIVIHGY